MSKFICATSTTRKTSSSSHHENRPKYISPLRKLDERTKNWQPKRVQEETRLKQLYEQGKCDLFRSLSSYRYYHVHKNTSMDVLDNLIDHAKLGKIFTIDTEDQLIPKQPSIPSLIQIEYVYENDPSILILIECMHLPKENEPTFTKIKKLCKTIFSMGHTIYSWGNLKDEIEDFYQYKLFDKNDIDHINGRNIQAEFKKYFNTTYPTSPDIKLKSNEPYSLQFAISNTFNEWLTKRYTLGNFGCGLDFALHTITVPRQFMYMQEQVIQHEKEIRQLLTNYALNDCLGVTKLVSKLPLPTSTTCHDELKFDYYDEQDDDDISDELTQNVLTGVHVRDEPYEMLNNDDDNISLPEIMKLQLPMKQQHHLNEPQERVHGQAEPSNEIEIISDDDNISLPEIMKLKLPIKQQHHLNEPQERVHGQDEPANEIEMISDDDIEQYTTTRSSQCQQHQQQQSLTRNQRKNRKKRANRYKFEVIRRVYYKFRTKDVKKILIFMNVPFKNVNVDGNTLFLDLKDEQMEKEVDRMLHNGLFTENHYYRIRKKFHLNRR